MSSLLQFNGAIDRLKGVGLQFVKVVKGPDWDRYNGPDSYKPNPDSTVFCQDDPSYQYTCPTCGKLHARIFVAYRKPVGMCGHFVVFRYNGAEQVPDLSIPISVLQFPKGAKALTDVESSAIWHGEVAP